MTSFPVTAPTCCFLFGESCHYCL